MAARFSSPHSELDCLSGLGGGGQPINTQHPSAQSAQSSPSSRPVVAPSLRSSHPAKARERWSPVHAARKPPPLRTSSPNPGLHRLAQDTEGETRMANGTTVGRCRPGGGLVIWLTGLRARTGEDMCPGGLVPRWTGRRRGRKRREPWNLGIFFGREDMY